MLSSVRGEHLINTLNQNAGTFLVFCILRQNFKYLHAPKSTSRKKTYATYVLSVRGLHFNYVPTLRSIHRGTGAIFFSYYNECNTTFTTTNTTTRMFLEILEVEVFG